MTQPETHVRERNSDSPFAKTYDAWKLLDVFSKRMVSSVPINSRFRKSSIFLHFVRWWQEEGEEFHTRRCPSRDGRDLAKQCVSSHDSQTIRHLSFWICRHCLRSKAKNARGWTDTAKTHEVALPMKAQVYPYWCTRGVEGRQKTITL